MNLNSHEDTRGGRRALYVVVMEVVGGTPTTARETRALPIQKHVWLSTSIFWICII